MSSVSSVTISSPSAASRTSAASTTSDIRVVPSNLPAARPRSSARGRTSIPRPGRTTPPWVPGNSPSPCNPSSRTHMERSFRSRAINAPASRIAVTRTSTLRCASECLAPRQRFVDRLAVGVRSPQRRSHQTPLRTQRLQKSNSGRVIPLKGSIPFLRCRQHGPWARQRRADHVGRERPSVPCNDRGRPNREVSNLPRSRPRDGRPLRDRDRLLPVVSRRVA